MSKSCQVRRFAGKNVIDNVWCELDHGHEGPHAAWTWERAPYPRVEWTETSPAPSHFEEEG